MRKVAEQLRRLVPSAGINLIRFYGFGRTDLSLRISSGYQGAPTRADNILISGLARNQQQGYEMTFSTRQTNSPCARRVLISSPGVVCVLRVITCC